MKAKKYILITILLTLFFNLNMPVHAIENWSDVTLTQLAAIKDDPASLQQVQIINVQKEDDINNLKIASICPNLQTLFILGQEIPDIDVLNSIKGQDLYVSLQDVYADFNNFKNEAITQLFISQSSIKNIKNVENLTNLNTLSIESTDGAQTIDFNKLTKLEILQLNSISFDDYNALINKITHVKELGLDSTNITNKDAVYLKKLTDLKNINLAGTYVDNIDFLTDLHNLETLTLPYGMENIDILYQLKNLKSVSWDAYTELQVTQKLVDYLDKNHIDHSKFDPKVNTKINEIITSLNLENKTDTEKIFSISKYIGKNIEYKPELYDGTSLQQALIGKYGVCHNYSILTYTLLKKIGIDVYYVSGYIESFENENTTTPIKFTKGSHAWNNVKINNVWYGVDTTWISSTNDKDVENASKYWIMKDLENPTNEFNLTHVSLNQPKNTIKNQTIPDIKDPILDDNEKNQNDNNNNNNDSLNDNNIEDKNIQNPNTGSFLSIASIVVLIIISIYCMYISKKSNIFHKL